MLTKEQKFKKVRIKLTSMAFNRVEVTSLSKEEVQQAHKDLKIEQPLEVWGSSSATYYRLKYIAN